MPRRLLARSGGTGLAAGAAAQPTCRRTPRAVAFARVAREARRPSPCSAARAGPPPRHRAPRPLSSTWGKRSDDAEARSLGVAEATVTHGFGLKQPGARRRLHDWPPSSACRSSRRAACSLVHTVPTGSEVKPSRLAQSGLSYCSAVATRGESGVFLRRHSGPAGGDRPDAADGALQHVAHLGSRD